MQSLRHGFAKRITKILELLTLPLFCHFPVSRMISNSQKQGILSDAELGNPILTNASTFENLYSEKIARSLAMFML